VCAVQGAAARTSQGYTVVDFTGGLVDACEVFGGTEPKEILVAQPDSAGTLTFWWLDGVCGDRDIWISESPEPTPIKGPTRPAARYFAANIQALPVPTPSDGVRACPASQVFRGARIQLAL
jgi:hypothetical protein